MDYRIYEARIIKENMLEITFYTGEVKLLDVKKIEGYDDLSMILSMDGAFVSDIIVSNKDIRLFVQFGASEIDFYIQAEQAYKEGESLEMRTIDIPNIRLAKSVISMRESMSMTQKDLESASGIHQADISRIERGLGNPSLDTIVRLAEAMHYKIRIEFIKDPKFSKELQYEGRLSSYLPPYKYQGDFSMGDIKDYSTNAAGDMKVELINGYIFDFDRGNEAYQDMLSVLGRTILDYSIEMEYDCEVLIRPFTVRKSLGDDCDTCMRPDLAAVIDKSKIYADEKGFNVVGGPDFVCEIHKDGLAQDMLDRRLAAYKELEVREYWILNPEERLLTAYLLDSSASYKVMRYGEDEIAKIGIFFEEMSVNLKGVWRFLVN